jgi:hypothetical protein
MDIFLGFFGSWDTNMAAQWLAGISAFVAGVWYFRLFFANVGPLAAERAGLGIVRTLVALVLGAGFALVSMGAVGMLTP